MLIQPDCIPCILNMSLSALEKVVPGPEEEKALFSAILEIPALRGKTWNITSAEVVEQVLELVTKYSGHMDPFRNERITQNERVLAVYPSLQETVARSGDPLLSAAKLAALGNGVDAMVGLAKSSRTIEGVREGLQDMHIRHEDYTLFAEKLKRSRLLVYLADNAGEAVLDKLFIETIKSTCELDVYYVVRSQPALNDVLAEDARSIGMEAVAKVVENGISGLVPGTVLSRCSQEIRTLIKESDLVISKGGGNFETLSEGMPEEKHVTFILLSKCRIFDHHFSVPRNSPILVNMVRHLPEKDSEEETSQEKNGG